MKIYDILKLHPDWSADPKAHRAEIGDFAHAYIWELFKTAEPLRDCVLWHDLNKVMELRNAIKTFCGIDGSQEQTEQNKVAILERLIKAVCWQLVDYSYCLENSEVEKFYLENDGELGFIAIEEWPTIEIGQEAFANVDTKKRQTKQRWPITWDSDTAKKRYSALKEADIIDCSEDDFLWYFSNNKVIERATETRPDKITWKPKEINLFAYFGTKCFAHRVDWKALLNIFNVKFTADQLRSAKNDISNYNYPKRASVIDEAFKDK